MHSHLGEQALDAASHDHRAFGLAAIGERVLGEG
jgi:hypothetical protein